MNPQVDRGLSALGEPPQPRGAQFLNDPLLNKGTAFTEQEREPVPIAKDEPLRLELGHFLGCVRERQTPKVSGAQAKVALEVSFEINRQIAATR